MNVQHPHDLATEAEVHAMAPAKRRTYVPVPAEAAVELERMDPAERAAWLAAHPADALRLARAQEKHARRKASP